MRTPLLLLFVLFFSASRAQFLQDVNGRPYLTTNYEQYEGSPLLFSSWVQARVVTSSGKVYDSMLINIDVYQDQPLFVRDGVTYTFTDKIQEFSLTDGLTNLTFKKGHLISADLPDVFMELVSTKPLVVKHSTRKLVDVPTYGTMTHSFRFADATVFYSNVGGSFRKITLSKKEAETLFASKWKEVSAYADQTDLSFKTEAGWRMLLRYYSTL
ncbi:MAG: hypothetical protein JWP27_477 [Flaviaesturariibacter sp.]|nr:hypothetical protein [Flaviaesturariibacter sp.]